MKRMLLSQTGSLGAIALVLLFSGLLGSLRAADPTPLRVLIFSGQNNHNWRETTPRLREILTASGRFVVDVTEHPERGTAEQFARYDVILSDWNAWGDAPEKAWPTTLRDAFLNFVRAGRGHVVVHAGGASFFDWTEYQQLIGGTWGKDTGHGAGHTFEVKAVDADHPITRGLAPFKTMDELWHRMATQPTRHVLATAFSAKENGGSGSNEPVAMITQFGQGRCFNLVLGHDVRAMESPGFQALLLRGTEWAASGAVTLPAVALPTEARINAALKTAAAYRFGDSREPLAVVERMVNTAANDPVARNRLAPQLAAGLTSEATPEARQFLCDQLSIVGSAAEVPALAAALSDPPLSYHARLALERIPGDESVAALLKALMTTSGAARLGVLSSLAARRAAEAVPEIARLATADRTTARAALTALGQIATPAAARALRSAEGNLPADLRSVLATALLRCAEDLARSGNVSEAVSILQNLTAPAQPARIRLAAFPLYAEVLGDGGSREVLKALAGNDPVLQAAAIRALRSSNPGLLRDALGQFRHLPAAAQVQLLSLCAERADPAFLPSVGGAVASRDPSVRLGAIRALAAVGDASAVGLLAGLIESASREEKAAIAESFARLQGQEVDAELAKALKSSAPAIQKELIAALVVRGARSAVPTLLGIAQADIAESRRQAIDAVGKLGDEPAARELVQRLPRADPQDQSAIETALVAICERTRRLAPIADALPAAPPAAKVHLIAVLAAVGDDATLNILRSELIASDSEVRLAAVRALSNWPTPAPLADLAALAVSSTDVQAKALARRAVARLAPLAKERPDEAAAAIQRVLPTVTDANERTALLSALSSIPSLLALQTLQARLTQPAAGDESAMAVLQVAELIHPWYRTEVKEAVQRVQTASRTPAVLQRAAALATQLEAPPNLALGGLATSPDGLESDGQAGGDSAAIDGDPKTYWDEVDGQKLYRLRVQLRRACTVGVLRLTAWRQHDHAPKDFEVVCDDRVVKSVANAQYQNNLLRVEFPPVNCTSVELRITGYYGPSPAIRELELYGPSAAHAPTAGFQWNQTDVSLALVRSNRTVWRLNFDPKEGKPYFHPLTQADGSELTCLRPADHPWHRAIWWSWKLINGLNYWEEDAKTGQSAGITELGPVNARPNPDGSARIELELAYHPPEAATVLKEQRVIEVSAPDAAGTFRIDWASTFAAGGADVVLDRTPIPGQPNGVGYGGYAGWSARLAAVTRGWGYRNSEGGTGATDLHGKPARWIVFSGPSGGLAVFDHPKNLRHPTPWYVNQEMPYFSPALLFHEPYTLTAGRPLTLRYRLLVHATTLDRAALDNEWTEFSKE